MSCGNDELKRTIELSEKAKQREKKMTDEKKKLSREEILERKVSMARERGSRVVRINSPLGSIMFNVLRQFDEAYDNFKGKLGEPGGISFETGAELMEEARQITISFSELTRKLSKKVQYKYYVPQELREMRSEKTSEAEAVTVLENSSS